MAAFVMNEGLFQFRVMPFGLCHAPATFERLMDRGLCGMRWSRCLVYLDDVISFGGTVTEAWRAIPRSWRRCRTGMPPIRSKMFDSLLALSDITVDLLKDFADLAEPLVALTPVCLLWELCPEPATER